MFTLHSDTRGAGVTSVTRVPASDAVRTPAGAGRDGDLVEPVPTHLVGRDRALQSDLDVRELRELPAAIVGDADPGGEPGQPRLAQHSASELASRLGEDDLVAPLAERHRCLEPRRASADDEHPRVRSRGAKSLGMPAAPPLLAHRRILGAADRRHRPVARDADVAADALADVLEPPLLDLQRQERVGDRGTRRADQVDHAVPDQPHHRVRRGQPADADDRLRRELLDPAEVLLRPRLVREARGARVVGPEADHHVPEVGQLADEREQLFDFGPLDALLAEQLVDDDAARDRGAPVALLERVLEDLSQEARAVLERSAVLVLPEVVAAREEVLECREPVRRVDVDEVVARAQRPLDRLPVAAAEVVDVLAAHRSRLDRIVAADRQVRRAERRDPAVEVRADHPVVHELDPGERAVCVDLLDEALVRRNVRVVPEAALDEAARVGRGVDLDLLCADDGPASLGLDAAHHGMSGRVAVAHAVAVGHLEEAVAGGHRPELDRLEQDVVARVAAHYAKRLLAMRSGVAEGHEGIERVPAEREGGPGIAAVAALPEPAVGETGEQAALGGHERVRHRR